MASSTLNSRTIRGITYNKGDSFVCAYSASGNGGSEGDGASAASLTVGKTYYFYGYVVADDSGTTIKYPCKIGSNSSSSSIIGYYPESIFPYATYKITFNANGGSLGSVPSYQTKTYGTTLTLTSVKPSRTGYTFSHWNTKADDSGTKYTSGANYTSNSAVTLYAIWVENALTVNYYSNYATESFADALNTVGSNKNVIVRTVTYLYDNEYTNGHWDYSYSGASTYLGRTGYTGTGYWGTSTSGGTLVSQSASYSTGQALAEAVGKSLKTGNASVNLYPQWQINTYTIVFNANGGFGNMSSQTVDWQETFTLSNNTFVREGYKFIGWNLYRNIDSKWYVNGQGWLTDDEILVGEYEKKIYLNQDELILDMSWIKGNEDARQYTMYAIWEISGVVYIDNGDSLEPYLAYIDNGSGWNLYLAYIDDGTEWKIIS